MLVSSYVFKVYHNFCRPGDYVVLCHAIVSCNLVTGLLLVIVLCYVVLYYVVLCFVMLGYFVLCRIALRYIMLGHVIISLPTISN